MLAPPEEKPGVTEEEEQDAVSPLVSRRPSRQDVSRRRLRRFSTMDASGDTSSNSTSTLPPQLRKHSSVGPGINVRRRSSIGGQLLAGGQRGRRHSLAASGLAVPGRSPNSGPGGKHRLWGMLRRKSSLFLQQTALQLLRKFRRVARVVLVCVHLNRLCQAVQRIKENEADTVSYLPSSFAGGGMDNFTGVENLMFNKADYKADRDSLRLSETSRAVLMSPPAARTEDQIDHVRAVSYSFLKFLSLLLSSIIIPGS
ncbi:uncharacterized protein LOC118428612 [Branchiostoma floridae]|uniref:Uncharacterized protein LOC118428612 n=1 Tax=Branchiostoma floridae TaxID=7739 RepID=A0A9J7N8L5_BRAFL|nr:uncharacterized protein LOC118428612 [Branchiostoma floridae]